VSLIVPRACYWDIFVRKNMVSLFAVSYGLYCCELRDDDSAASFVPSICGCTLRHVLGTSFHQSLEHRSRYSSQAFEVFLVMTLYICVSTGGPFCSTIWAFVSLARFFLLNFGLCTGRVHPTSAASIIPEHIISEGFQ
jgi:hypothetical protein